MTNREYAVMNITKILDAAERLINSADFDGIIKYTNMACAPTVSFEYFEPCSTKERVFQNYDLALLSVLPSK